MDKLNGRWALLLTAPLIVLLMSAGCGKKAAPGVSTTPVVESTPPPPPEEPVKPAEKPKTLDLSDVFFDYDRYNIRGDQLEVLNGNAKLLVDHTGERVLLEGHCDERGTVEYNLALGERRANAVRSFLVQYGVDGSRLTTISYGEEKPFATGSGVSAWSQNRGVHFVRQSGPALRFDPVGPRGRVAGGVSARGGIMIGRFVPFLLLPALLGGCYGSKMLRQPVTVDETAREIEAIRQQQAALEARLGGIEARTSEQSEVLRSLRAENAARWSEFDTRLSAIDSKLRDAIGAREGGYARGPSLWSAAPGSTSRPSPPVSPGTAAEGAPAIAEGSPGTEGSVPTGGADAADAGDETGAVSAPVPTSSGDGDPKRIYDQAYKDLSRGSYALAMLGFGEYLRRAPASDLADNAQYWIGECHYAQREFNEAIREFLRVPEQWPGGDKAPAALLKIGYSYLQLGDRAAARRYLNQVIEEHPDSEEATSARNKLRSL